jgi:hypothetical protein
MITPSTSTETSMTESATTRRSPQSVRAFESRNTAIPPQTKETEVKCVTFTKTPTPEWVLAFWKEIDDKTWGKGFDCFAENATANLGVSDWHGREAIRGNLRAFVDKGFTAHHDVVEFWDGGQLKVFRGFVTMTPNDPTQSPVRPAMTHFFYMDEKDPSKVIHWHGSVGPVAF